MNRGKPQTKQEYISQETAQESKQVQKAEEQKPVEQTTATVCLWNNLPLRQKADNTSKFLASISLGETVAWTGDSAPDASNKKREFIKIKLSDGTVGWANRYCLVTNAKTAVVKQKTDVYKRPDQLTITGQKLQPMKIVPGRLSDKGFLLYFTASEAYGAVFRKS